MATRSTAVRPGSVPDGVQIRPRRFEFRGLDEVPQYWFAGNPVSTHIENTFSILIPPGERFFIRAVRHFADRVTDPDARAAVDAFTRQEALHSRAHVELNASFARFGVDVDREAAYADRVFARLQRVLSPRMRLGVTAFLEHLTATAAHSLFAEPLFEDLIDPEMRRFWRWHAAEELEHKAVAFDLYRQVGGTYVSRVLSALVALAWLAFPYWRITRRMVKDDPHQPTADERRQARDIERQLIGRQLRLVAAYFGPGFHPWDTDDRALLAEWYAADELG